MKKLGAKRSKNTTDATLPNIKVLLLDARKGSPELYRKNL